MDTKYIRNPYSAFEPFMRWHKIAERNAQLGLSWTACGLKYANESSEQTWTKEQATGPFCHAKVCREE